MLKPLTPIQQAWVAALRSGKYNQTKNYLQTTEGYCCLGVLCEVAKDFGFTPSYGLDGNLIGDTLWKQNGLAEVAGLKSYTGYFCRHEVVPLDSEVALRKNMSLDKLNDCYNTTFEELADVIEWNADLLFK